MATSEISHASVADPFEKRYHGHEMKKRNYSLEESPKCLGLTDLEKRYDRFRKLGVV